MKRWCIFSILITLPFCASAEQLAIYCEEAPPYQIRNHDGSLSGLVVDVVREIQRRTGNADPIQMVPWNRGYTFALHKKNTVLFSAVMTDERKRLFQWVGPIMDLSMGFYAKKDSPIRISSHDDARKVRGIAVYGNDIGQQYLEKQGYHNLIQTYDNVSAQKDLLAGRLDLVSMGRCSGKSRSGYTGIEGCELREVLIYMKNSFYIVFSRDSSPDIVASWNRTLDAMKKDGSFDSIFRKYIRE